MEILTDRPSSIVHVTGIRSDGLLPVAEYFPEKSTKREFVYSVDIARLLVGELTQTAVEIQAADLLCELGGARQLKFQVSQSTLFTALHCF